MVSGLACDTEDKSSIPSKDFEVVKPHGVRQAMAKQFFTSCFETLLFVILRGFQEIRDHILKNCIHSCGLIHIIFVSGNGRDGRP